MGNRLQGKIALVTGAGSGIGEATARLFASEGAAVGLIDIDESAVQQIADEIVSQGGKALALTADVADTVDASRCVKTVLDTWKRLDVLFNNAGISCVGPLHLTSEDEWDRVIRVNVRGVYIMSKAVLPTMLEQKSGTIIQMSSAVAEIGVTQRAAYSASKGAVLALTRAMQADYASYGIRVNALLPGTTYTPFVEGYLKQHFSDNLDGAIEQLKRRQASGTLGSPHDIASAALFLASDEAKFMYGSGMVVDGGMTAVK